MRFESTTRSVLLTLVKDRACVCLWWKQVHTAGWPLKDLVSILQILPQTSSIPTALSSLLCPGKLLPSIHLSQRRQFTINVVSRYDFFFLFFFFLVIYVERKAIEMRTPWIFPHFVLLHINHSPLQRCHCWFKRLNFFFFLRYLQTVLKSWADLER